MSAKENLDYLIEQVHNYGVNYHSREIFLFPMVDLSDLEGSEPGVEHTLSSRFIVNLKFLENLSKDDITIHLKSGGGDWVEGMAIFDNIQKSPCKTFMINHGQASSMSSVILQAADVRYMMPNSHFMFHEGSYSDDSTMKQTRSNFEFCDKVWGSTMMDIYAKRLQSTGKFKGKTLPFIKKQLKSIMDERDNVYLTAKEAVQWGFADKVL